MSTDIDQDVLDYKDEQDFVHRLTQTLLLEIKTRRRETLWRASLKVTIAVGITSSHSEQSS